MAARAAGLLTALATAGAVWAWRFLDPTAPQGPALPAVVTAALAANVALTLASVRLKRAVVAPVQRYLLNPPVRLLLRLGLMPLGYALLETRRRVTGLARTPPVGNGLHGGTFWVIAEYGRHAGYVRNIQRCPHCRLEIYLTNPAEQPDPTKWETQLAFRLK